MTEEKRQSIVQPEQIQGFNFSPEDELNLNDFLSFLARKKKFILTITSVFILSSIFYAQSIIPTYRATVGLIDQGEKLSSFYTLKHVDPKLSQIFTQKKFYLPHTIFKKFLLKIESYKFKKGVFVNGSFQEKFFPETRVDTDQDVLEIYDSTKIVRIDGTTHLELEGSKPKVMLEFLTALVEAAKENTNTEINDIVRSVVKARINNLSTQIEELHQKITVQKQIENQKSTVQKQIEKEKKIARLSKALDMAKRMGIKNNNFDKPDNGSAPVWFRYGELALQQKIKNLRSKEETFKSKELSRAKAKLKRIKEEIIKRIQEETKSKELSMAKAKLKRLQTADLTLQKFKVATISKPNYYLAQPYKHWMIVGFGVALGLFISIFMALLINLRNS